uniref:Protein YIPF n=11 Tax=Neoaves TaxID=3078114 RepID=A0A8C4V7X1_FALTI
MGPGGCRPSHRSGPDRRHAARAPPCWRGGAGGQPPLALPWAPWRCVTRQPAPRVVMTYFVHVARVANMAAAEGSSAGGPLFAGLADVSISEDIPVEGEITVPVGSHSPDEDYSTLDEPVRDTIMRDLKAVGKKFVHVMYPKKSSALLRDWDLWGPLVLCVSLALMLQGGSADSKDDGGPQFAEVFVIIWFGAVVITLNSKLLGGTISFFQSLCVLGYCVLPLTVAMLVCRLVLLAGSGTVSFIIRLIVVVAMFGWSTLASTAFLADSQPPNRKALVVYPIFLFYFVISWMILTFTPQ